VCHPRKQHSSFFIALKIKKKNSYLRTCVLFRNKLTRDPHSRSVWPGWLREEMSLAVETLDSWVRVPSKTLLSLLL
jgi:hypothetical protein